MSEFSKMIVVTGPAGVGKSTIILEVRKRTGVLYSVSATTRQPRPGEQDGKAYHFVDRAKFESMIAADQLLEWAEVYGQYYGTPAEPVRRAVSQGKAILADLDVQGAVQVHRRAPDANFVLILPPNGEELERRLRGRGTEDGQALARRINAANEELAAAKASGIYNHTITNDDLAAAVERLERIVQQEQAKE